MIPVAQGGLTLLLRGWQGIAVIGVIALAFAHTDGQRRPFFRRHRFLYGLIWPIVAPVVGAYLLLTMAGMAAVLWMWINGDFG
ncbi:MULTISPECIES: hypothetical protein [unclassified Salipiger]|uniref:hypothetical protein n=1 Tax=unclassified Salipiger TaxID=2640570 RepID=UPI0013B91161|nr:MULTISPECIES: hypothetical protein [unclassified Salipiger]NDV51647.1 hypothetical protein [Salipiger sp. PrR003]NDW34271.1 hypothetical protein [Salipiger sp. PrR007]